MKTELSEKRYYSIGEVASSFKVKPSLIRFWEQEFKILNPKKNSRGNRKFTSKDIENFNKIYVNNIDLQLELKEYLSRIAPDKEKIVKLHKKKTSIFQEFNVTKQIKLTFGKNVTMKKGVYLVIEHTEALHVIDVNSGKKVDSKKDQEER